MNILSTSSTSQENDSETQSEVLRVVDSVKLKASNLQKYITSSVSIMPAYDVRRTQEMIDKLNSDIKALELSFKPKKRFTFSSRTKTTTEIIKPKGALSVTQETSIPMEHSSVKNDDTTDNLSAQDTKILSNISGEIVILNRNDFPLKDGTVRHQLLIKQCNNSIISAVTILGSVRIEHSTDCSIYLGPCCTSAYLESCTSNDLIVSNSSDYYCTIFVSSHQLRIHECHGCNLYVKVNSHPIIEDCQRMGFAPYPLTYKNIDIDFQTAALSEASNWSNVVDFRWHKKTQSPNWYIISDSDRIRSLPDSLLSAGWTIGIEKKKKKGTDDSNGKDIVIEDEI